MTYRIVSIDEEPISLELAKQQCRIDIDSDESPDDALIRSYISAARGHCEDFTGLTLARKTIELAMDMFPEDSSAIELLAPANKILSVNFYDNENVQQSLHPDSYTVDNFSKPGWLVILNGYSWPGVYPRPNAVKITYEAGYGTVEYTEAIPEQAKIAILLTIGHMYENREEVTDKAVYALPLGVESLLRPLRVRLGMA